MPCLGQVQARLCPLHADPKLFIWKATHADILGNAARTKAALLNQPVG